MRSQGILGELLSKGVDAHFAPRVKFTRERIAEIANTAAEGFRDNAMNLISSFGPLEGECGVWQTLDNFIRVKNPLGSEIEEAVKNGDEYELLKTLRRAFEYSFVELYNRGALARLQLVDALSPEAMSEWIRLSRSVASTTTQSAPVAQEVPAAPPAPLDPVEQCAADWKEMSTAQFKRKYVSDTRMRPYFDAAQERELL